jgi:uncharacterized protein DUF87
MTGNSALPTLIGHVVEVTGSTVRVRQSESVSSGVVLMAGRAYRIGQVGSFVRIPLGYQDLLGVVSQVGDSSALTRRPEASTGGDTSRWLTVQLVGESISGTFERGVSQFPSIDDEVHLVCEEHLRAIYGRSSPTQVEVGRLASAESIPVRLDLDKLVTRHAAVVGSTGSGKSTTVASLLRALACAEDPTKAPFPSARILLLDVHGEYASALGDVACVFRINARRDEQELVVPYWALEFEDLMASLVGDLQDDKLMHFRDQVVVLKRASLATAPRPGASEDSLTVDSPVPFSLKQLWYNLMNEDLKTFEGASRQQPALIAAGDPEKLIAPQYKPWVSGAKVVTNPHAPGVRRPLDQLRSRLFDRRFDFLLHPGDWEPDLAGIPKLDLDELLKRWLGHDKPISILDLSGVPSPILVRLVAALLRIVYDALFWSREKSEGGTNRPLLVVGEEAHVYLSTSEGPASAVVRRIAKEGRKYGIGMMVVSQRPSEVDESILSQCGTFVALRLANASDRARVQAALPDSLAGLLDMLPALRTGEAIITGEAARLPMRARISLPPKDRRPQSEDPLVPERWGAPRLQEDYTRVLASWRAQSPRAVVRDLKINRKPIPDSEG